jgi:predicted nucleic acid-binding protein
MRCARPKRPELMELVLADSSFYIHEMRAGREPFREMEPLADAVEWATTGMVILEVCRGLRDPLVRDLYLERFSTMVYLPTTNLTWEKASLLAWEMDRKGRILPSQDLLIASACLRHDARLLTRDGHFDVLPGLRLARELDDLGS